VKPKPQPKKLTSAEKHRALIAMLMTLRADSGDLPLGMAPFAGLYTSELIAWVSVLTGLLLTPDQVRSMLESAKAEKHSDNCPVIWLMYDRHIGWHTPFRWRLWLLVPNHHEKKPEAQPAKKAAPLAQPAQLRPVRVDAGKGASSEKARDKANLHTPRPKPQLSLSEPGEAG
jgi:hypothetical protein